MNTITPFLFGESTIRTMMIDSKPWFVAKDICECLSIANNRDAVASLDDDEKITVANPDGNPRAGIPHENTFVSESGLYALVFKSRKPEAVAFRKWVTSDVLPAIRKNGAFGTRQNQLLSFMRELIGIGGTFKEASILTRSVFPPLTAKQAKLEELEKMNADSASDPDGELFASIMAPGIEYRVKDFFASLPPGHRILAIKSPRGRDTAIGMVMERLVRSGRLRRINARHATFALASAKIVPMER